ncbi:MAG TPA: MFS transporter [Chitinophagaceae bacterium]|nr:MFS transporter [Chitinophagaceae bacterium]
MNISLSVNIRIHRIAVSVFFFIAGLTVATWAGRIPDIKNKLHLNEAALGGVLFALPVGQLISLPLSGWLIPRFGSRQLVIAAAMFFPLTLILLAIAATAWQLVIVLFFFGVWANLINIAMNTQAVSVENLYGKSIMASFHGLWSLAGFSGAAIANFFVSAELSPLTHFSIICVLTGLLVFIFYKYTLPEDVDKKTSQPLFVKPDKTVLLLGLIAFCCMVCEGAMADWSGVYFQKVVASPAAFTTLGYVAFMGTMATGRFLGDGLVTKFGIKRILQTSGVLIAAGLMTVVLFPYLFTAIAGCLLVGFGVSCVVPIVYALAGKSTDMSAGLALAAVSTIGFLGFLIGPPLIGFIAQAASLRWSFSVIALLGMGTTILAGKLK